MSETETVRDLDTTTKCEPAVKKIKVDDKLNESNVGESENGVIQYENSDTAPGGLSKRQLKKIQKRKNWLKRKPELRAKEKEKLKQKKLDAQLNNISLGPSRKSLKHSTMSKSNCHIRVVMDLSFGDYMNAKAMSKCIKQLLHCYSLNRRAKDPMQLHLTSFNGKYKEEMSKHTGYENWDIYFHEESFMDVFKKEEVVYLTSESDNVISVLEEDKVYIIGGLVDHNSQKGLCYSVAQEHNISHGQLPIKEYLDMKTRTVLTIDHVFEILLGVSEGKSWKDVLLSVVPSRKGAIEKDESITSTALEPTKQELVRTDLLETPVITIEPPKTPSKEQD